MAIDLHIHTKASSDGEFSAQEIVEMAHKIGLEAIAITDHDTIAAVDEGLYWGRKYNLECIPGAEITTTQRGKYLHMLGYYINQHDKRLLDFLSLVEQERMKVVDKQISKIKEAGYSIEKDAVLEISRQQNPLPSIYAQALFEDIRNQDNPILAKYRDREKFVLDFTVDYLITGRDLNAPDYIPPAQEVVDIILSAGGVPVLAHPGATLTEEDEPVIQDLLEMGLVGLEAYSNWHTPEQQEYYADFCKKRDLLITCGSDFHGKMKPEIALGSVKNNTYQVVLDLQKVHDKTQTPQQV